MPTLREIILFNYLLLFAGMMPVDCIAARVRIRKGIWVILMKFSIRGGAEVFTQTHNGVSLRAYWRKSIPDIHTGTAQTTFPNGLCQKIREQSRAGMMIA